MTEAVGNHQNMNDMVSGRDKREKKREKEKDN